ncbi:uncharacterized protein LOC116291240 [Actinia tenebrosa]|uniref:Uncharacterized protein LOC116291240 n=1 Tax=Actinia tenebrosa TaxID=6105 RepID=A0A6P8HNP8_ACTTE|nr:uncharacterized protein LOC116291240 [Actinia tenebrosa]
MCGTSITINALVCFFIIRGAVSTVTTHNQNGCHNSDVILTCPQYALGQPGNLVWRFKDKTTGVWSRVASIRNGQTTLNSANTALDGRSAIHPNGSLEIHSLRPDDETMYQCIVRQGSRKLHVINLNVSCGKVTVIKREVCIEEDVVLSCDAWHRTNPRKLHQVKWHEKNTSGNDVSWSLLVASSGSNVTVGNGLKLHGNGSLFLPAGRNESDVIYKCDVTKNDVASRLDRHIIVVKNVKCQREKQLKGTIKTTTGRVALTTVNPNRGINVAMATGIPKSQVCGGVLNNPVGTFQSPNFPSAYPANSHCKWTISLPPYYAAINLTLNQVNLEDKVDCLNDNIAVYDDLAIQVGCRVCGNHISPLRVQVRGRVAVIVFRSNGSVQKTGFQASYNGALNAGKFDP